MSARFQLGNWSAPARLGSAHSQIGSAGAGKIQLGLITSSKPMARTHLTDIQNYIVLIIFMMQYVSHDIIWNKFAYESQSLIGTYLALPLVII